MQTKVMNLLQNVTCMVVYKTRKSFTSYAPKTTTNFKIRSIISQKLSNKEKLDEIHHKKK